MIPLTAASSKVRRASQLLLVVVQTTSGLATASAAACTAASFSTQPDVAFEGENINNTAVGTVEECEEFCCSTAGCIAFTFTEYYPYPTLHSCLYVSTPPFSPLPPPIIARGVLSRAHSAIQCMLTGMLTGTVLMTYDTYYTTSQGLGKLAASQRHWGIAATKC